MTRLDPSLAHEFEAALAWWHMAGVDCDFSNDATAWLAERPAPGSAPEAAGSSPARQRGAAPSSATPFTQERRAPVLAAVQEVPAARRRDLLGDSPPGDLAAFRQWWMDAPGLSPSHSFPRVPPRGGHGAALMVLVPQPEAGDSEHLLSGPQGRLLENILAAMGLDESAVYIAAALPAHTPMADLSALAAEGMDAVTIHHIGLVAPERLIAFGTGLGAMLGTSDDHPLREINHAGRKIPATLSETLDALMEMPRLKARFWRRWTEWSATH
jgi:DNA polymerase